MVEYVDSQTELLANLVLVRDTQCEDPETVPISELRDIADWAWSRRLEGKVYHGRNSEFRMNRAAVDALAGQKIMSDALALFTVLVSVHGHQSGKTFKLNHQGMREAGHTDLSRRRFLEARRTLEQVDLLKVAKKHSSSRSATSYQLCRPHQQVANIVPVA